MKVHITNIYNNYGTGGIAQQKTAKIAKEMGFGELDLYWYNTDVDNDIELGKRIDGIIPAVKSGDIVFFQSPSWNDIRYDFKLINCLKRYPNLKIAILIHDVIPLMRNWGEDKIVEIISLFNLADLIIAPSHKMLELLCKYGLNVKKHMIQKIWDYPIELETSIPGYYKRIFFTGAPSRFPFIQTWKMKTLMCLYCDEAINLKNLNVEVRGYQKEYKLLLELSEGGYGLVWSSEEAYEYYSLLQPYKTASFLAAGIPVILQKGLAGEEIIVKNRLGFVVESLEEADAIVQNTTETEYNAMVKRISEFNFLIKNGWFTRKLLTDAVMWLLNDNYKPE